MHLSAHFQPSLRNKRATRIPTVCVVDPQADDDLGCYAATHTEKVQLHFVATAEAALRLARTAVVDLWLVNTKLPGLSGYELCSMLKARSTDAFVYLVTDEYSEESERAAWQARASLFGVKPTHYLWLSNWLMHWRAHSPARCAS